MYFLWIHFEPSQCYNFASNQKNFWKVNRNRKAYCTHLYFPHIFLPTDLEVLVHGFFSLCFLCSYWLMPIILPSSLLTHFSVPSILLLNPCTEFFYFLFLLLYFLVLKFPLKIFLCQGYIFVCWDFLVFCPVYICNCSLKHVCNSCYRISVR